MLLIYTVKSVKTLGSDRGKKISTYKIKDALSWYGLIREIEVMMLILVSDKDPDWISYSYEIKPVLQCRSILHCYSICSEDEGRVSNSWTGGHQFESEPLNDHLSQVLFDFGLF